MLPAFATAAAPLRAALARGALSTRAPRRASAAFAGGRARMSASSSEAAAAKRAAELRGPEGIFSKIVSGDIPANVVYQDELCMAFTDLNPQAPTHMLVIPKRRVAMLEDATQSDKELLGHLMLAAAEAARLAKLDDGYRVIVNNGYDGLQSVGHLHLHGA